MGHGSTVASTSVNAVAKIQHISKCDSKRTTHLSLWELLLLRSPARSLGSTIFGEIFPYVFGFRCCCCCFFVVFFGSPVIEIVTFRLRGWCMLGVFLLPAFIRLGHERQDLLSSAMECMCAQTRPRFILSSERVLRDWSQNPC